MSYDAALPSSSESMDVLASTAAASSHSSSFVDAASWPVDDVEGERASGRVDATQAAARDGEIREGDEVGATITVFEGAKSRFFVPQSCRPPL